MEKTTTDKFDQPDHMFVPKHMLLSEEEENELLVKYNISKKQLPCILVTDPAIKRLNPKIGDIIKIIRNSQTSPNSPYYRVVISGK